MTIGSCTLSVRTAGSARDASVRVHCVRKRSEPSVFGAKRPPPFLLRPAPVNDSAAIVCHACVCSFPSPSPSPPPTYPPTHKPETLFSETRRYEEPLAQRVMRLRCVVAHALTGTHRAASPVSSLHAAQLASRRWTRRGEARRDGGRDGRDGWLLFQSPRSNKPRRLDSPRATQCSQCIQVHRIDGLQATMANGQWPLSAVRCPLSRCCCCC